MTDCASRPTYGFSAPEPSLELSALEAQILALWKEQGIESQCLHASQLPAEQGGRAQAPFYAFYDGPPFATGLPHYGHLLAGTIKDIVPRYWFMKGRQIDRRFGWDCHGLPIESLIEKELGVHGRAEIEALGVPKFNAACRAGVLKYTQEWEKVVRRMGRWVDFENDYKTMDRSFMESVWWVFSQLWEKGLIYEGYRVQPVSPSLGTPLSNFEVAQGPQERDPLTRKDGHKRRQDPSLTVRFALEDEPGAYLWAWTTTPWTLPSNLALAVNPEVEYAKVKIIETGEIAYIEPGRLSDYQARERVGETKELERIKGESLVGRPYAPLFPFFSSYREHEDGSRWAFRVLSAEYVTTESGTGIVHQAPGFGEDDYAVCQANGLPLVNPLNLNGIFDESVPPFAGQFAKDADKGIIEMLKADNKIVDQDVIVHPYPHCYRSDKPLLYMAISTWFMKVESIKEDLVRNNEQIRWVPEHVGSKRFGNWIANARDWNLSRNRYWGTPLPVWRCDEDPSDMVCVGSVAQLESLAGLEPGSIKDLHREVIDEITFPSQKTPGGTMRRITEVFDCWFESGSMPYAQNHYPFNEEKKSYVENNLPADFIAEGLDQTRGWFYTLHVLSTALFNRPAFKNVIVNGLILAADGKKMSKRLKNYPDPAGVIERFGADALRAYLINSPVVRAEPMRFGKNAQDTSGEAVRETVRTAILPLWNAYNFLATYARADGWQPEAEALEIRPQGELDRWILSRIQSFVANINAEYEAYRLYNLVPAFLVFCDDLNNWYIRRGRRRYWRSHNEAGGDCDKKEAYATLYRVLATVSAAMAPILPFFSEYLFQKLVVEPGIDAPKSVHLQRFPEVDQSLIDSELEEDYQAARDVVALGMVLREREKIGVRRPLPSMTVACADQRIRRGVERFISDIKGELNVRKIEITESDRSLVSLSAKANFKVLGKRLGPKMKQVAGAVSKLDHDGILALIEGGSVEVEGESLSLEDLIVKREALPGRVVQSSEGITVVLDTQIDEQLAREGLARELINRVQNLRKASGLDVSDKIRLRLRSEGPCAQVLQDTALRDLVASETLCVEVELGAVQEGWAHTEAEIDGEAIDLCLERVS